MDDMQARLYATTDAQVWARDFCETAKKLGHDLDEAWMVGWFANAIENAKDHQGRKSLKNLKDIVDTQCTDGNWNYDPYMRGMANGLLLAQSVLDGQTPEFKEAPPEYLCDRPAIEGAPTAETCGQEI